MESPNGIVMCRCDDKRAGWYLKRNLAVKTSEDPPTIRLTFTPEGMGNAGDEFYTSTRDNACVVCGTTEDLTKHHIIPTMYRTHLPEHYKSWSSHDVVVICINDHKLYETEAWKLKVKIGEELGISINDCNVRQDIAKKKIRANSYAIINQNNIPEKRRQEILGSITAYLGHEPSIEELLELSKIDTVGNKQLDSAGKLTMDKLMEKKEIDSFIKLWRQHFIDVANPQYMPKGWSVERKPRIISC